MAINWQLVHDILVISGTVISFIYVLYQFKILVFLYQTTLIYFYFGQDNFQYPTSNAINSVFLEPYLFGWEAELFYKYLSNSRIYFEYGSGGMTHQAIKNKLKVYVAETHQSWIHRLNTEVQEIKDQLQQQSALKENEQFKPWYDTFSINITYIVSDIQSGTNTSYSDTLKYIHLYNHSQYKADFICLTHKLKFAITMYLYNQIDSKTIILIHDIENPDHLKIISKYFDVLHHVSNTIIIQKKKQPPQMTTEDLINYEKEDIYYQGINRKTLDFLRSNFSDVIDKYRYENDSMAIKPSSYQIWFMWWQGIQSMPSLVRVCYESIKKNFQYGTVTLITEKNYQDYVTIPEHIVNLYKSKKITIVNFSDVLRVFLICTHGGLWLDATMMVIKEIQKSIFDYSFYTVRAGIKFFISYGKWCMFLQASKINSAATRFVSDMFDAYFKKYDSNFNYWMIDYFYFVGYEYVPIVRRILQKVPVNNWFVHGMEKRINDVYDVPYYNHIVKDNTFLKLTYKMKIVAYDNNNRLTMFGHFQKKYLFDVD